jgi:DhnA family fructose-bisphosphate aldolase class Ia
MVKIGDNSASPNQAGGRRDLAGDQTVEHAANEMLAALKDIASYYDPAFGDYANVLALKARDAVIKAGGRPHA